MTKINVDKSKVCTVINIKDHAGAERNENGSDLVCCSCSILLYTLISALEDYIVNDEEVVDAMNKADTNNIPDITIKCKRSKETDIIIDTILKGYQLLEKNYKKNVKVLTTF